MGGLFLSSFLLHVKKMVTISGRDHFYKKVISPGQVNF